MDDDLTHNHPDASQGVLNMGAPPIWELPDIYKRKRSSIPSLEDIARLQSDLDLKTKRKNQLDVAIHEHRKLLTPFRQIPDDILCEIFSLCLPQERNALMSASEAPLLLGRVCSRWRSLAYNSPNLWTTLHLSSPNPPPTRKWSTGYSWVPLEQRRKLSTDFDQLLCDHRNSVSSWLDRSEDLPLSISLDWFWRDKPDGPPNPAFDETRKLQIQQAYLDVLFFFSTRWRSLELTIPPRLFDTFLAYIRPQSLPNLQFLTITFRRHDALDVNLELGPWKRSGILDAKNLRVIQFSPNPWRPSTLDIDWSRITHVMFPGCEPDGLTPDSRFENVDIQEAFLIFTSCKHLQHCTLGISQLDLSLSTGFHCEDVIRLPHLESLSLVDGSFCLRILLECLQVPRLRDITYFTRFPPGNTPLLALLRHEHSVRALTTSLDFLTEEELAECFTLVPNLTHLNHRTNKYYDPHHGGIFVGSMFETLEQLPTTFVTPTKIEVIRVVDFLLRNQVMVKLEMSYQDDLYGITEQDVLGILKNLDAMIGPENEPRQRFAGFTINHRGFWPADSQMRFKDYLNKGLTVRGMWDERG